MEEQQHAFHQKMKGQLQPTKTPVVFIVALLLYLSQLFILTVSANWYSLLVTKRLQRHLASDMLARR